MRNTYAAATFALGFLAAAALTLLVVSEPAEAAPIPVVEMTQAAHDAVTAHSASALSSDNFTVSCGVTATSIRPTDGRVLYGFACVNDSATLVAVGGSSIGDPTSSRNSPVICPTCTEGGVWSPRTARGYCRADTGTVTLYCTGRFKSE